MLSLLVIFFFGFTPSDNWSLVNFFIELILV